MAAQLPDYSSCALQGGLAMTRLPRLLMLIGAATPPGRLASAIAEAAEAVRNSAADVEVEVMNLAETAIDICDGRPLDGYCATTREAVARIDAAAAVLVAAPVYRASFPGVLKNLFDIAPVTALQGKPVGIVAMGGSAHHYLAVDTQLRQVLSWFGALVAPTGVYLTGADFRDGQLASDTARQDLTALAETLLILLRRLDPAALGPTPLAAKFT
jgi:FMN reductase